MIKRHPNIEFTADFPTVWFVQMMWETDLVPARFPDRDGFRCSSVLLSLTPPALQASADTVQVHAALLSELQTR